jgi:hypothetical protein
MLTLFAAFQVIRSGIPNFCAVALALHDLGYAIVPWRSLHVCLTIPIR